MIPFELPPIDLKHLTVMTDETGLIQHAIYTIPNREQGYCTDDNARALTLVIRARKHLPDHHLIDALSVRYLAFLHHAYCRKRNAFRNFLGYDRRFFETSGSQDCQGRAVGALAEAAIHIEPDYLRVMAKELLTQAVDRISELSNLRSMAIACIGLHTYMQAHRHDDFIGQRYKLLWERLYTAFLNITPDSHNWLWPERQLTYANAVLPHALILAGTDNNFEPLLQTGLHSLAWLMSHQKQAKHFSPIGNQGWYAKGGRKACFDQQPIEAETTVSACLCAYEATSDPVWLAEAVLAFRWFLGENDLGTALVDQTSGGCRDGLGNKDVNQNQGAESTLAWLTALVRFHELGSRNQPHTYPGLRP